MSLPIKRHQLENYRKALLNRVTSNIAFMEYVENCLAREDEAAKHSFHKIMVHNWSGTANQLFDTLTEYFGATFIPVMFVSQGDITSFYTSSLGVILKMIKLDFMFPFQRNMFNIDILFNDRNSADTFDNAITIEDIVCSIVSNRINEKFELDLSNFCNDPEFAEKQINFYKINLLSHFKIFMLRMGRDTRSLNLSNNNLSQVPVDILNFFIKGELIAINLSYNNIPSLAEVLRVSSRIEKLWIEGNPLCDDLDPVDYVKNITMKFPRLKELDGVNLNQHGLLPYFQNFLVTPDRRTKMVTEKFLTLYFTNYEGNRRRLIPMYDANSVVFTLSSNFDESADQAPPVYTTHTRNVMDPDKRLLVARGANMYKKKDAAIGVLCMLPAVTHDPSTFTVDVMHHNKRSMILVVDGIYKEKSENDSLPDRIYQFRRTFVFKITPEHSNSLYTIKHEMFSVQFANKEQLETSFKFPVRNMNELALIDPDSEDIEAIVKIFTHITQLKRHEVEARLKLQNWDIRKSLKLLIAEVNDNKITADKFIEDDDFSDSSSLIDDEID